MLSSNYISKTVKVFYSHVFSVCIGFLEEKVGRHEPTGKGSMSRFDRF